MILILFLLKKAGRGNLGEELNKYGGGFVCIHFIKHADVQAQISALLGHLCGS